MLCFELLHFPACCQCQFQQKEAFQQSSNGWIFKSSSTTAAYIHLLIQCWLRAVDSDRRKQVGRRKPDAGKHQQAPNQATLESITSSTESHLHLRQIAGPVSRLSHRISEPPFSLIGMLTGCWSAGGISEWSDSVIRRREIIKLLNWRFEHRRSAISSRFHASTLGERMRLIITFYAGISASFYPPPPPQSVFLPGSLFYAPTGSQRFTYAPWFWTSGAAKVR